MDPSCQLGVESHTVSSISKPPFSFRRKAIQASRQLDETTLSVLFIENLAKSRDLSNSMGTLILSIGWPGLGPNKAL